MVMVKKRGVGMKCRAEHSGEGMDRGRPCLRMIQPLLPYRISRRQRPALMRFLFPLFLCLETRALTFMLVALK